VHFRIFFYFFLLFSVSCNISHKKQIPRSTESSNRQKPYYIAVPITKRSSIRAPCLDVCIENSIFSVELDLGYQGNLTFTKEYSDTLHSKAFLREKTMYGIKGKEYPTKIYQVPALQIGKMTFLKPTIQEEEKDFSTDATFVHTGQQTSPCQPGRLGWELFYNVNLLVDSKNSLIAFCDGLETLKKHGYKIEEFTCTPLLLERGLIEFYAETSEGLLRCVVDTASTWNILNRNADEESSIENLMWNPDNIIEYSSFRINQKNFSPLVFHRLPIRIPIRIDAILGMDFFDNHLIFLDFKKKYIYFLKN
jgi:hypothetical protein